MKNREAKRIIFYIDLLNLGFVCMEVVKDLGGKDSDTEVGTIPWLECVWDKPVEEAGTMIIVWNSEGALCKKHNEIK